MNILVTGASGFLGSALVPKLLSQGHRVYALSRHPPAGARSLIGLRGDITKPNLGLTDFLKIDTVQHLAGIHSLGKDKNGLIHETNYIGTKNVIDFCAKHNVQHLCFTSTAYLAGRNPYEKSKAAAEKLVRKAPISKVSIFRPSIIMGTEEHHYPGHFSQFVLAVIKIHRRAELVRRKIEGALRLPVLEPVFRIKGDPEGKLNLVSVDDVAEAMATIDKPGEYWLTNPEPPTLGELTSWISELIMVRLEVMQDFKPTPIEKQFQKMAAAFQPYLWGNSFKSDLASCSPINGQFIQDTIKRSLQS